MSDTRDHLYQSINDLRRQVANINRTMNIPDNRMNQPIGMAIAGPGRDHIQRRIDRYLSGPLPVIRINPKYSSLPDVGDDPIPSVDFRDDALKGSVGIYLPRLSDNEIVDLGKRVMPMIQSGFSHSGAAAILVLAYQLKNPSDHKHIFVEDDMDSHPEDVDYSTLDGNIRGRAGLYSELKNPTDDSSDEMFYPYLAASMLRLFTMAEENYIRAFDHIKTKFQNLYDLSFTTTLPNPNVTAIKSLTFFFRSGGIFKATLFKMLYAASGTTHGREIKRFLYDIHLSNAGIHIMSIFIKLRRVLGCSSQLLLSAIDEPMHKKPVEGIFAMINLMNSEAPYHQRKMWRFGRIFDESFMCQLQTKSCFQLVYVLASALRRESYPDNQNILAIRQLDEVSGEKRRLLTP